MFPHQCKRFKKPLSTLALLTSVGFSLAYSQSSFAVPSLSFDTSTNGAQLAAGSDLPVIVTATERGAEIAEVSLSVNGDRVRTERFVPFRWGDSDRQMDPALKNLSAGTYQLTVVATNDAGESATETISVQVLESPDNGFPDRYRHQHWLTAAGRAYMRD